MTLAPAQLHQIARDERARRKAAWNAAGQGLSDHAAQDDVIWSNIEHCTALAAGEPAAAKRAPSYYTLPEYVVMTRNAWVTACKAETTLDASITANRQKILDLWHLFHWLRPLGWSPLAQATAA